MNKTKTLNEITKCDDVAECCFDGSSSVRVKVLPLRVLVGGRCCDRAAQMFHVLLSAMLSSQTKDEVTHAAMMRLRSRGCT